MNQSPLNILSPEWGWDNIRRDVFQLVAWGYQRKEKEIRQHNLEEDITGLIRQGINETLDELDDDLLSTGLMRSQKGRAKMAFDRCSVHWKIR